VESSTVLREDGSVGKAVAASVWTGGGDQIFFQLGKKKGGWRVKESCCLMDEGNIKG